MQIEKNEFLKLIKSPFVWFIFIAFFLFNIVTIYSFVGEKSVRQDIETMHKTILEYGVDLQDSHQKQVLEKIKSENFEKANARSKNRRSTNAENTNIENTNMENTDIKNTNRENTDMEGNSFKDMSEYRECYHAYVETNQTLYDNLNMLDILEQKENMNNYHPAGAYAKFIYTNYEKLQKRVEEIKRTGEGNYGFYPGQIYEIHKILYIHIGKNVLLETAVLVMLSILFLMDYERLHRTRTLVITTRIGKKVMRSKALMGLLGGLLYSFLLMAGTFGYFFWNVSFAGLWNVPVSSTISAESRGAIFYPFVTFWRLSEAQYFLLVILISIGILLIVAVLSIALQMLIQNSYLTFLVQCLLFMSLILFAYWHTTTFFDVIKTVCNPVILWITCGAWFMENDFSLSFAGNEFWCIGCSGILVILLLYIGYFRYKKLEIK